MTFLIDGTDVTKLIAFGGIKFKRNDIDGPNAGRGLDGSMIRDRVAIKGRWDFTVHPCSYADCVQLLQLLQPEWLTLTTDYNMTGEVTAYTVYTNNIEVPFLMYREIDGELVPWVNSFTFPIVEK